MDEDRKKLNLPTVQLLHELPDGSAHVDWLFAPPGYDAAAGEDDRPLIAMRAPGRVDEIAPGESIALTRIADHRLAYLDYEGPVSGDRGSVRRLCPGVIDSWDGQDLKWGIRVEWKIGADRTRRQRLRIEHLRADEWLVRAV